MTIPQVASTQATYYQPSNNDNQQHNFQTQLSTTIDNEAILTTEQKNSQQNNLDAKLAEQVDNIKSNYQTAKDMDLTRLYYQQQQRVIEAYMYSNTIEANNKDSNSVTGSLTELYASLYEVHQAVKSSVPQWPNIDDSEPPVIQPVPMSDNKAQAQADKYHSIMMPSNSSHIYLSA